MPKLKSEGGSTMRIVLAPLFTKHQTVLFPSMKRAYDYAHRKGIVNYNLLRGPAGRIRVAEFREGEKP